MVQTGAVGVLKAVMAAAAVAVLVVAGGGSAMAGSNVNTGYFGGVAIMGYDPVAYFTQGRPVKGSPEFQHEFLGETWHFSSAANRDAFAADPVAYAPQYGGYCAGEVLLADVSTGVTTNIDPGAWRVIDGKLYLFYDRNYAKAFEARAGELVGRADANWPKVEARLLTQ